MKFRSNFKLDTFSMRFLISEAEYTLTDDDVDPFSENILRNTTFAFLITELVICFLYRSTDRSADRSTDLSTHRKASKVKYSPVQIKVHIEVQI